MNSKTAKMGSMEIEIDGRHLGSFDMLSVPTSEDDNGPVFSIADKDIAEVRFTRSSESASDGLSVESLAEILAKMQSEADAVPPLKCPVCGKEYKPAGQNWTAAFERWDSEPIGQVVLCSVNCVLRLAARVRDACSVIAATQEVIESIPETKPQP
jgi:hypothetical protein